MVDQPNNFLPIIYPSELLIINHTFSPKPSLWNETDPDSIALYHHPALYGIAIYALFLIIIGTIGNVLTIIILLRSNLRKYTTMRYLIAVAIADLCALYSWNLNLFYKHLINPYQNDLEDSSLASCRILSFFGFVSLQLSSWYLTLVSLDRCLNIHFLFWHRQMGRANRVIYIILCVTGSIVVINIHLLFLNGYQQPNCVPFEKRTCVVCYARLTDPYYIFPKWEQIHVIIYNFFPFSIMFISNYFIIRRSISSNIHRGSSAECKNMASRNYRQRKQKQLTYLLLLVTFLFVSLTTPVMIYNVFLRNSMTKRKPLKYIVQGILLCVQYTSHAINFFIYCHSASKFRHELNEFLTSCTCSTKQLK